LLVAQAVAPTPVLHRTGGQSGVAAISPPRLNVPNVSAALPLIEVAFAPVLVRLTTPAKRLAASVSVMVLLPASTPEVPVTCRPPAVSLTAPPPLLVAERLPPTAPLPRFRAPCEVAVSSPAALTVPNVSAALSLIEVAFAPV